jgi:hypothetical protein
MQSGGLATGADRRTGSLGPRHGDAAQILDQETLPLQSINNAIAAYSRC